MYQSALALTARRSTVHQTLLEALAKYPSYGLVLCGHSLGGGVAALLSIKCAQSSSTFLTQNLARPSPAPHPQIATPFVTSFASGLPPGRPIHCYAYGPPAITSPDLARYTKGLITSVVQNSDVVPCLSLGVLRDLKNVAVTLSEEGHVAEEIVGRVSDLPRSAGTGLMYYIGCRDLST
jgi:pimeloyl-ACP methyl ester carboxylesterase